MKFLADTKMADSKRELEMQKASFNQEVNTKVFASLLHIHMYILQVQHEIKQDFILLPI